MKVTSLPFNSNATSLTEMFQLQAETSLIIDVSKAEELIGDELTYKSIEVASSREPISLFAMSSAIGSCDGFLALPVVAVGREYLTVSYYPPAQNSEIGLVAVEDGTIVTVSLRRTARPGLQLNWNGSTYTSGDQFTLTLDRHETAQLQDHSDLTGTRINASRPVIVLSGNDFIPDGFLTAPSHLVEQLPPIESWGRTFYLAPMGLVGSSSGGSGAGGGYQIKFISNVDGARVAVDIGRTASNVTLADAGNPTPYDVGTGSKIPLFTSPAAGAYGTIRSDSTLLVAQFARGPNGTNHHRAMTIVPPVESYKSLYIFSTGSSPYTNLTHFVSIVAEKSAVARLTFDGRLIFGSVQSLSSSSSSSASSSSLWTNCSADGVMVGTVLTVDSGVHRLEQLDGRTFGAIIYGAAEGDCAYAFPVGMCL